MADLPQQETIKQYLTDGVQTAFTVPFFVPLEDDGEPNIDVYVTLDGETPVPDSDIKVWGVDYTYTSNIDPITGGTLNFLVDHVPPNLSVVTIDRNVQASLDVEFSNATTFSGANLDDALDKLLLIEQQNKTYAYQRNLSYIINSYLPDATRQANVQIPVLESQQVWMGSAGGVIAVTLEQDPDVSTLRSELANAQPVTNGAALIGYYDIVNAVPTTVSDFLNDIYNSPTIDTPNIVGVTDGSNAAAGSVGEFLSSVIAHASAISLVNGVAANVTSITLTPGDWDVWGNVGFTNVGTFIIAQCWTNTVSASVVDFSLLSQAAAAGVGVGLDPTALTIVPRRFSVTVNTTVYLSCAAEFSNTVTACGGIYARRVR